MLHEAEVALAREYEVVEEGYAEELACFGEAFRDVDVLGRGFEPARGMVMADDDRAGPVLEGIGVDLAGMDDRRNKLVVLI